MEVNLIAQIRALPNPSFTGLPSTQTEQPHPLTLHLSPTSTANIIITYLSPPLSSSTPFAGLAPDAEVIVAPKTRPRLSRDQRAESRSNASAGQQSAGGRSALGPNRRRTQREEALPKRLAFLRGIGRSLCTEWFDNDDQSAMDDGFKIWVGHDVLAGKGFLGLDWVCVSLVEPASLQAPSEPQQQQRVRDQESGDVGKHATKIVVKLESWLDSPDSRQAAISSDLCAALGLKSLVGSILRIEKPPIQTARSAVQRLNVYPFTQSGSHQTEGLRFGGQTQASKESTAEKLKMIFGASDTTTTAGILNGPLTDGLVLPSSLQTDVSVDWEGGILRFDPRISAAESEGSGPRWLIGSQGPQIDINVRQEIMNPFALRKVDWEHLPSSAPSLVGVDELVSRTRSHLLHNSSVLLSGGLGSGKTSISQLLGCSLQQQHFYHVSYFSCRKLVNDETRVSTIREIFSRIFMTATWATRMGGHSLIIFDDLDRVCPAETELQVGGENGRSRQLSELLRSTVRQYCGAEPGIVLLLTTQNKDGLNSIIVGDHIVREIVDLKAPSKDTRRQVLESILGQSEAVKFFANGADHHPQPGGTGGWMDGSLTDSRPGSAAGNTGFDLGSDLDLLDIASQTDGYMPGDLVLLTARARSEALIRATSGVQNVAVHSPIQLSNDDFRKALDGFTPASLRNVTLQTSSTTFDSIGGLHDTRKILLETLQYPTTYAPIFAQCPLRLRSGLLLYGYPGCGKTLLASAVAGECGLNFISVKGPEILNKYIGASEKSVRDLFDRAEAARPCVLFFDEFDSIAPKRGHDSTGVTDRVVNQLLTQMDGAEGLSGVYVLAATSRPDLIDPALLRPGRLDKSLVCGLPDLDDRLDILRALSKKLNISPYILSSRKSEETLAEVASRTEGYSGADLQAVIYNAHLEAIHDFLGDHKGSTQTTNGIRSSSIAVALEMLNNTRNLIQFRYGENEDRREAAERAVSGTNRSKELAERNALIAKLDGARKARRKERALRREGDTHLGQIQDEKKKEGAEVIIEWQHIEASLSTTRSSISPEERRKLGAIYREFQVGRNGEMPNGQGGMEVGGRSSLM